MRHVMWAAIAGFIGAAGVAAAESAVGGDNYTTPRAVSTLAGTSATLSSKKAVIAPPENYKPFPTEALKLPFEAIHNASGRLGRALYRLDQAKKKYEDRYSAGGQLTVPLNIKMLSEIHGQGNPPPGETPEQIEEITRETDRKLQEMQRRSRKQEAEIKARSEQESF